MIKRFFLTFAVLAGLLSPALGAGTITISLTQRFDNSSHLPLSGGKIFFIQAGTTATPQNAFQDSALTLPYANPLTLDSGGNIPQLFFADGVIKIRITNSVGVQQIVQDNIQVTGASSGGGGGGTVDPTTILSPCDIKVVYGTGNLSGFVRMNGRTIGNAVSGATERANADTLAAFSCLYANDNNLVVSGGRGASAAVDYAAGKTIATPDYRGRAIAGLDDMGNSAAGRLTATYLGAAATTLGVAGGSQSHSLSAVELATHTHAVFLNDPGHSHGSNANSQSSPGQPAGGSGAAYVQPAAATINANNTGITVRDTAGGGGTANQTAATGNGTAFSILPPIMLVTVYCKL